ncbi:MAG: DUF2283 domain-containing protein [Candidatus Uhrbacteria bacterium]
MPKIQYRYEPEADVLSVEVSRAPIDSAVEMGNVVVHLGKQGQPVLLEFLEASQFASRMHALTQRYVQRARTRA